MNIVDYIPYGHENAISRLKLKRLSGKDDRSMRVEIAKKRIEEKIPIVNLSDGNGYFIATKEGKEYLERYVKQEEKRSKEAAKNAKACKKILKEWEEENG